MKQAVLLSQDEASSPQAGNEHPGRAIGTEGEMVQRLKGAGRWERGCANGTPHLICWQTFPGVTPSQPRPTSLACLPQPPPHLAGHWRERHLARADVLSNPRCTSKW